MIIIYGDKFLFAGRDSRVVDVPYSVFYEVTYNWIGDQFIELSSTPLKQKIDSGVKITQCVDTFKTNQLVVNLSVPKLSYAGFDMEVSYITGNASGLLNLWCEDAESTFSLPPDVEIFHMKIQPFYPAIKTPSPYGLSEFRNGYVYYELPGISVNKNVNNIHIEIPDITSDYFTQYLINGELLKIEDEKIIWHGVLFTKNNRPEDTEFIKQLESKQHDVTVNQYLNSIDWGVVSYKKSKNIMKKRRVR